MPANPVNKRIYEQKAKKKQKKFKKCVDKLYTGWYYNKVVGAVQQTTTKKTQNMWNMERYRSGHNGAVLKTVCLHGRMGSNPILSAENHL